MRMGLPLRLIIAGILLIAGSIGLMMYFFEYESDNGGALFGVTVVPVAVGLGAILVIVGIVVGIIRLTNRKKH
ncbi:MAG: hypothetical protein QM647_14710 [Asticcacaulis sp.]|uniref:hypothetical protein n=1 Tax=Asticcacaulis sp. TaxID=1872648 RepID=UPI0039E277C8